MLNLLCKLRKTFPDIISPKIYNVMSHQFCKILADEAMQCTLHMHRSDGTLHWLEGPESGTEIGNGHVENLQFHHMYFSLGD